VDKDRLVVVVVCAVRRMHEPAYCVPLKPWGRGCAANDVMR
jgi:hypothetical protein